jgi:hypothetical protein
MCRSPKIAGLRLVTATVCRACPFADHSLADDESALDGDVHPGMSVEHLIELLGAPARAWPPGWGDWAITHAAHRLAADRFLAAVGDYPADRFRGRGIVVAGGGPAYFPSLYVTVRAIRHVGCSLPIQVWYLGREDELPPDRRAILARYGVECVDADAVRTQHPCRILNGWELKVYAVLHAPFEEVLSLDADCYPVRDPSYLFDEAGFRHTGAVFWPDLRNGPPLDQRPFGVAPTSRASIESGQFLLNKSRVWRQLQLAWWYNDHSDWSYLHGYGDKHTLEVAWAKCGAAYTMYTEDAVWGGDSFHHVGPEGRLLLLHRCRDKFRFGESSFMNPQPHAANRFHPELPLEAECFRWLEELRRELDLPDVRPAAQIQALMYTCPERRTVWEATIGRWRQTDWGADPVVIVDAGSGPPSGVRHVETARRMFARAAEVSADYSLFLEDDLLFNAHLAHNLARWPPLLDGALWMGTLYNPGLALGAGAPAEPWNARARRLAHSGYYGSQAIVLSRAAVALALREWDAPGLLDLKLAGIALRHGTEIVLHSPSLVQHVPVASACGTAGHRAVDFDPFFRA